MTNGERIARFIQNQYVTAEGDVRANVEELFSSELVYHVGGSTLSRDDMVTMGETVRSSERGGRRIEPTGFLEDGETVRWHMSAYLPGFGPDGSDVVQETDVTARFGPDSKIVEMWSVETPITRSLS